MRNQHEYTGNRRCVDLMGWYKTINSILEQESEAWLAYLFGQQLENLPHLTRRNRRFSGLLPRIAKFGMALLRDFRVKPRIANGDSAKFLFFAGTVNQMNSLDTTIDNLKHGGESVVAIANRRFINNAARKKRYTPLFFNFQDVLRALTLLVFRGPKLYRQLMRNNRVKVDWYFDSFCGVYSYLTYFHRILIETRPEFVVTANDHNAPNRCMLAAAHHLGIKTVYLQHASVSNLFPALRVDYAFLDGQSALETYRECEKNQPASERIAPIPRILLTGQKKHLTRSENQKRNIVGIALNALDDPASAIDFVKALAEAGFCVYVRWHPGQADRNAKQYLAAFRSNQRISLSNPKTESVSEFMGKISWLIASNSSIHLEAALSGVTPIYYELTPADNPDYYGYVKLGVAKLANSNADVLRLLGNPKSRYEPSIDAVRYYSATYLTEWDGREGELVAACLTGISQGKQLPVNDVSFLDVSECAIPQGYK